MQHRHTPPSVNTVIILQILPTLSTQPKRYDRVQTPLLTLDYHSVLRNPPHFHAHFRHCLEGLGSVVLYFVRFVRGLVFEEHSLLPDLALRLCEDPDYFYVFF